MSASKSILVVVLLVLLFLGGVFIGLSLFKLPPLQGSFYAEFFALSVFGAYKIFVVDRKVASQVGKLGKKERAALYRGILLYLAPAAVLWLLIFIDVFVRYLPQLTGRAHPLLNLTAVVAGNGFCAVVFIPKQMRLKL